MQTEKLKLMVAVTAAAVVLIGTGAIVAVGQERKPAEAGKPDPEWNKQDEAPTAFPDIKPFQPKDIPAFIKKRVPTVLESDPPLRKLQKAKLRAVAEELRLESQVMQFGDQRVPFETILSRVFQVARETVATGLELADRPEDRRAWLELGVGIMKDHEIIIADRVKGGLVLPSAAWNARRHRLDAEIALLKHIEQSGGKAK